MEREIKTYSCNSGPNGFNAIIIDGADPQTIAMLQAMYSRDASSCMVHLETIKANGSNILKLYYVKYGHKSIGDCAPISLCLEGVCILFAKAVQDSRLYNGQEVSTRYVNISEAPLVDPVGTPESASIQRRQVDFYTAGLPIMVEHLKLQYPYTEGSVATYTRAINARAFDVMRAFIPAGLTTKLSLQTNFRQAYATFTRLKYHPDNIISEQATKILKLLVETYPDGFSFADPADTSVEYLKYVGNTCTHVAPDTYQYFNPNNPDVTIESNIDMSELIKYKKLFDLRPRGEELPPMLDSLGTIKITGYLDYGSFRDLQRHRSAVIPMPLLTPFSMFNEWYYAQMPGHLERRARELISEIFGDVIALTASSVHKQYYLPLGTYVQVSLTCTVPSLAYILELRSGKTVHETLRHFCINVYKKLCASDGVRLKHTLTQTSEYHGELEHVIKFVCMDFNTFSLRRGEQTIEKRV